jgi:signal transduction histidine kinase
LKKKDISFSTHVHELRNPLNSLLGSLDVLHLLLKTYYKTNDEIKEVLEIGKDSGEFLLMMVNNLLDH